MFLAEATVHTSGVNWLSVATIVSAIVVPLGLMFAFLARSMAKYIANSITRAIDGFHIAVVTVLDTRLTRVEQAVTDLKNTQGRDTSNDHANHG